VRLSDLLSSKVIDASGKKTGCVHDVRMVQDGPMAGSFGASFRISGLIVGRGAVGSRLGFDRSEMKGPLFVKSLFRALHSSTRFVPWEAVAAIEKGTIFIKVDSASLSPPEILGPDGLAPH
jgi:sporulation protein YlmC with PRC-barrel domain